MHDDASDGEVWQAILTKKHRVIWTMQVNIWKTIYLNCKERYEDMIDYRSSTHNLSSCEIKAWKNSGLNGIRTHDLCDTGAVLYQLSYQGNRELVTL